MNTSVINEKELEVTLKKIFLEEDAKYGEYVDLYIYPYDTEEAMLLGYKEMNSEYPKSSLCVQYNSYLNDCSTIFASEYRDYDYNMSDKDINVGFVKGKATIDEVIAFVRNHKLYGR